MMNAVWLGEYPTLQEAAARVQGRMQVIKPKPSWTQYYQDMYEIYHSCYGALRESFSAISQLSR